MTTPSQAPVACSACGKPLAPADVLYTPDALPICAACFARGNFAAGAGPGKKLGVIGAGGIVGLAPFVFSMSASSYSTVNGVVQHAVYRDWFAVAGGVIAAALGLLGLATAAKKPATIALGLAVIALGGFQIARGFGAFWTPSSGSSSSMSETVAITNAPAPAPAPAAPDDPATCADGHACFQLAERLEAAHENAKAVAAYTRACDEKTIGGCHNAGVLLRTDKSGTADPARAVTMFQRECDLDHKTCDSVGEMYFEGVGVAKDHKRAAAAFQQSCDAGGPAGCSNLGALYQDGDGVAQDPAKALDLLVKACDLDNEREQAAACDAAGVKLFVGTGVTADPKRAVAYFTKACDRDDKRCHDLGVATERGQGIRADPAAARVLYKRACDAGNGNSCFNLGIILEHGKRADLAEARALYQRGCDAGQMTACANLGFMVEKGRGGAKDKAAAKALYKQACDGGDKLGCDNLHATK